MAPASAETYVTQPAECNWGDVSSALFRENATDAAWEISATYANKGSWGDKQSPGKLYAVSRGLYRVTYTPSSPKQKIIAINVRSSGSVEAAGGQQCTSAANCKATCMDAIPTTPADDLIPPLVDIPLPEQILLDAR